VKKDDRTMQGICRKGPEKEASLACMPDRPPPGGPPKP
jgi:hypothetical protein